MKTIDQYINEHLIKGHTIAQTTVSEDIEKNITEYLNSRFWKFSKPGDSYYNAKYKIGKDNIGYYIDSEAKVIRAESNRVDIEDFTSLFTTDIDRFNKYDNKRCPIFRWRNHKGNISLEGLQKLKSLNGLPESIETIYIKECYSKQIDLGSKTIKKIRLHNCGTIALSGNPTVDEITWLGYDGKKPMTTFTCKNMHIE